MTQAQATQRSTRQPPQAQRIVSLLPAATEIVCFLGLEDRLVGISHQCGHSPALSGKPRVTFSALDSTAASGQIDAEVRNLAVRGEPLYGIDEATMAELNPALIVTQAQCDVCAVRYDDVLAAAQRIAPDGSLRVLALKPATLDDIFQDILRVGSAAGVSEVATDRVKGLRQRMAAVEQRTASIPVGKQPRVAVIEWIEPLMIAANWTPELVAVAGGQYGLAEAGRHSTYVPWDDVRRYDPQVLLVAPCGFDLPRTIAEAAQLATLPGWHELSAVRDGRIWALDGDVHFNCPSPGVVDTLELLGHLLYPQRMPAPVAEPTWKRLEI